MKKIIVATKNSDKFREISEILKKLNVEALSIKDYEVEDPEETGKTFRENSLLKAKYYAENLKMSVLADDSGICIEALGGDPGVYTKRFAEESGGFSKVFDRIQNILKDLHTDNYNAYYICDICLYDFEKDQPTFFSGQNHGKLIFPARGKNGFGYDPVFIPNGFDITCAEMTGEQKNEISHRRKALDKLKEWLEINETI